MASENLPLAELPVGIFQGNEDTLALSSSSNAQTCAARRAGSSGYCQAALDSELARLRAATEGERNVKLNLASFSLGSLVAGGGLERHKVEAALLATAISIGLTESEARATIKSGMDAGTREPRTVPERGANPLVHCTWAGAVETPAHDEAATPFGPPAPVASWLDTEPPPVDYLFEGLLVAGIVGGLFAQGGTGKTYLKVCLMLSAALGLPFFRAFRPTRAMRVLGLLGEDPQDMIHRRVRSILAGFRDFDKALLGENLRLYCGHPAPFMMLNGNNPARTVAFEWLKAEIDEFRPGLIIIDPKSMFYGLDENSNDHCTQWVNTLKDLTSGGASVLFSHHIAKSAGGTLELTGARGGSALVDGSRFAANMRHLTEDDAKRYDIDEPWRYVEFKVTKNSYAPRLPGSVFFKFTEGGALEEVDLEAARESVMVDELVAALTAEATEGNFYTAREVTRMKALLPDVTARERKHAVGLAIEAKRLSTEEVPSGKIKKTVLVPEGTEANKGAQGKVAKGGTDEVCDIIV